MMKLTCVTATFNCIKAGNRERLIRCVESVAKLKIEHEHLIYDGASTDGTVDLLRELESITPRLKIVSEPDAGIYDALNKEECVTQRANGFMSSEQMIIFAHHWFWMTS